MFCPNCDSANIRKLSLIYESGLSFVDTKTGGVGVGFGRGGIGAGIGRGRTKGTHTTALGAKAAPPLKHRWSGFVAGVIVCSFLTAASAWFWVGILIFGVCIVNAIRYNKNVWPQLYSRWDAAYMCERCGEIGNPRRGQPAVVPSRSTGELEVRNRSELNIGDTRPNI